MTEPLIKIRNNHAAECGDPPIIDGDSTGYIGYFQNAYGEQWVFTRDRESGKAILRGGDTGWNTEFQVVDGRVANLILSEEERLWLIACWTASRQRIGN